MNFSKVIKSLNQASAFELYRIRAAIDRVLDEPRWMQASQTAPITARKPTCGSASPINGETALPVQVITRSDIVKAGLTTAAEIIAKVSANSNGLSDGGSIQTGGYHNQSGFNSANLRGIGTSSTLVLLNGRRMANFASPGDDSGVDLNTIPAAAIQRVEILLDGASAIYGTDAIGGVINFITRSDFQGLEVNAYVGATTEGGAGKRTSSIAAGTGDYAIDGFNLFGVLDLQQADALSTSQRRFINELQIPLKLPHLLSSATFPGNIRLSRDQFDYLQSKGFSSNGKTVIDSRTINLSAPACNPPANLYLPLGIGGADACTYDYMRDIELYPQSDKASAMGRGTWRLNADTQLFAEASLSRSKTNYVGTSNRVDGELDVALLPALAKTGLASALPDDRTITVRTRLLEAGRRMSELTSLGERYLVGLKGPERSRQFSFGAVLEPSRHWILSADYWSILKTDLISEVGDDVILSNLAKYGSLVHRHNQKLVQHPFCNFPEQ